MKNSVLDKVNGLLDGVSKIKSVKAIGRTGDRNEPVKPGETDIDIFVLGDEVPGYDERKTLYDSMRLLFEECSMSVCEGGNWGTGDIFIIDGVETMLMYFRIDETEGYLNEVLAGKYPDCEKGFYPIGRCATFYGINVIYDEEKVLCNIKDKLSVYPEELRRRMVRHHLSHTFDEESFGRAIVRQTLGEILIRNKVL